MSEPEPGSATTEGPVLAIFAHPDDAEIAAGGTLAKLAAGGRDVHLLVLTNGDRGSQDRNLAPAELAAIRVKETEDGARVLGLASTTVLDVHDGELENTPAIRAEVARVIRRIRREQRARMRERSPPEEVDQGFTPVASTTPRKSFTGSANRSANAAFARSRNAANPGPPSIERTSRPVAHVPRPST